MNSDGIQEFFRISSRVILIVPFVAVFVALVMRYQVFSTIEPISPKKESVSAPLRNASSRSSVLVAQKAKLDPKRDFNCFFYDKEASVSAFKKENNIAIRQISPKETDNYLVNGDCIYIWKKESYVGQKTCNVGQYVSLAQTLLSMGLFDLDSLLNYMPNNMSVSSQSALPLNKIKQVVQTCVNTDIADKGVFDVPKNVVFKERKK